MFSWVQFAIALLKLVNSIITWAHDRELISQGQREEIDKQAAIIKSKIAVRDEIRRKIDALPDSAVDAGLRDLEPK